MRDQVRQKLLTYFDADTLPGLNGTSHKVDGVTRIPIELCECLADLHKTIKPELSIETGLAYGFSTLSFLDAMNEHNYGQHIAIDPGQTTYWSGVALVAIENLQLADRLIFKDARSDETFVELIEQKKRSQFIFFDGSHLFESVLADIHLANRLLDVGGLLIVNNMWLPVIRAVVSFMDTNFSSFLERYPAGHENIRVYRKVRVDDRRWDHFAAFDGTGQAPRKHGIFGKLFAP